MLKATHAPNWVEMLDAAMEPIECEILGLPVVVEASNNAVDGASIRNFCIEFYPIIREFPYWVNILLKRSPRESRRHFRRMHRHEKRYAAMWRAMSAGFGVPRQNFEGYVLSNPSVNALHNFLTDIGANGPFPCAVAATSYAAGGAVQKIAAKALLGLRHNEDLGKRGRRWLEAHAKYHVKHPFRAPQLIRACLNDEVIDVHQLQDAALRSLELVRDAMRESYHP